MSERGPLAVGSPRVTRGVRRGRALGCLLAAVLVTVAGCVRPAALDGPRLDRVERVAIVALLGDELGGPLVGTTRSFNEAHAAEVGAWRVDARVAEALASRLSEPGGPGREAFVPEHDRARLLDGYRERDNLRLTHFHLAPIAAELRRVAGEAEPDLLVLLLRETLQDCITTCNPEWLTGYGLYRRSVAGIPVTTAAYASFSVVVLEGATLEPLSKKVIAARALLPHGLWQDGITGLDPAGRARVRDALVSLVEREAALALRQMGLLD